MSCSWMRSCCSGNHRPQKGQCMSKGIVAQKRGRYFGRHRTWFRRWGWWDNQGNADADSNPESPSDQQLPSEEISGAQPAECLEDRCTSEYVAWMQQSLNQ